MARIVVHDRLLVGLFPRSARGRIFFLVARLYEGEASTPVRLKVWAEHWQCKSGIRVEG